MNPKPNATAPALKTEFTCGVRIALAVVSGITAAGGILRAADYGKWDWETLLYFLAAVVILLVPWIAKLKVGKDGIEFEFFKSIRNTLEENGVGGMNALPATPPHPGETTTTENISNQEKASLATALSIHPDDPQRGRWGGLELSNQRRISATIKPIPGSPDWFVVRLIVSATTPEKPLAGKVTFHVHPTFKRTVIPVTVKGGKAVLELVAWGAFTVGAECDSGGTKLELDLSTLPDAPEEFLLR